MNRQDHARLRTIVAQANTLMDASPVVNPKVTNAMVIEALIGDVSEVSANRAPCWLADLIKLDGKE